ncbi:hypothetical protein [Streptomyces sp. NPDC058718]|uniref:hypothetical protein n=1 Tax=Streptomyces sp. NPDC058718 TaxID=3346610 RepID=UPI0036CB4097
MSMSKTKRLGVAAFVGITLLGASPAFAADIRMFNDSVVAKSYGANGAIAVSDVKADSREVYANYHRKYTQNLELRNSNGNGTTVTSANDTANPVINLQACIAVNFYPDNCTDWWR